MVTLKSPQIMTLPSSLITGNYGRSPLRENCTGRTIPVVMSLSNSSSILTLIEYGTVCDLQNFGLAPASTWILLYILVASRILSGILYYVVCSNIDGKSSFPNVVNIHSYIFQPVANK